MNNQQRKTARWWSDWALFTYHFSRSNYITASWNWFLGMAGKAAEPLLFASVLYSGYKLLPRVTQPSAGLDAFMFVAQMAALDIGGMGLMKLAQKEKMGKDSLAYRVGFILVGLMIANVVLATVERLFLLPGSVGTGIEAAWLIARAVMSVIYGYAIHSLRSEDVEPTEVVKSSDVHARLDELAASLQKSFKQHMSEQLAQMERSFQQPLNESSAALAHRFQQHLTTELSSVYESFQQYQEGLAVVPNLQAQLQQMESAVSEELHRMQGTLEKQIQGIQSQGAEREKQGERPALRALPSVQGSTNQARAHRVKETRQLPLQAALGEKWDARAFIFSCLEKQAALKLTEIKQLAHAEQQELSEATISRYRKQFFASRESSRVDENESATLKVESADASGFDGSESRAVGQ